ncbi:fluoride efflux transporter FluC [Actinocorallia populi]|uniref:fluoride efflux transporter FluC n=1 Tax=Actinocorallia populi TaxID=2079200 RepID=UPI000D096680|nr:CrcB family protein [Actinocorallia populi]
MAADQPRDPDVDLGFPAQRRELERAPGPLLGAIALGGALGAAARHGLTVLLPTPLGGFALATFLINVTGCLLIGALMAAIAAVPSLPALTRPFLGVGFLGGFTTFSTYAMDVHRADSPLTTVLVLSATPLAALPAVRLGAAAARIPLRRTGTAS